MKFYFRYIAFIDLITPFAHKREKICLARMEGVRGREMASEACTQHNNNKLFKHDLNLSFSNYY